MSILPTIDKKSKARKGCLQFKSGTWYAVLSVTVDGEKIRKRVNLQADSKPAARRKLARLTAQPDGADVDAVAKAPETYTELAERVTKRRKTDGIVDTGSEEGRERLWILPEIGELAVGSVKPEHIIGIYDRARDAGKSRAHLCHLRAILRSRFAVAIEEEIIASNPMDKVRIPKMKTDRRERTVLTDAELVQYLGWQHPDENYRIAVLERQTMSAIARVFGGLRTEDLHALRWSHFDVPDFTVGTAPRKKTARPQRIAIPAMLRPMLFQWWQQQHQSPEKPPAADGLVR